MVKRHKIFLSYHHANDEYYCDEFRRIGRNAFLDGSVDTGDINPKLQTDTIRRKIRDEYIRDASVTVVLVGKDTWRRKHVDWEIGASIRETQYNARCGLLGILLPTYPQPSPGKYNPHTIPPRLHYNIECEFADLYEWSMNPENIKSWIHKAWLTKKRLLPDNSYPSFVNNRRGDRWYP